MSIEGEKEEEEEKIGIALHSFFFGLGGQRCISISISDTLSSAEHDIHEIQGV